MTKCCRSVAITSPLFLVIAMLLLPCSTVLGQELRGVAKECLSDIKTQCAGIKPGGGRIRECIKTHFKDVSEACRTLVLKAVRVRLT
jgi:Cysteine rich repeat